MTGGRLRRGIGNMVAKPECCSMRRLDTVTPESASAVVKRAGYRRVPIAEVEPTHGRCHNDSLPLRGKRSTWFGG